MRVLKRLLYLLLLIVLSVGVAAIVKKFQPQVRTYIAEQKPCRTPLKYSIGEIDPRFNITAEQLKNILAEAEIVWEEDGGLNLFEYDPNVELKIKMVYDERQQGSDEAGKLETDLAALEKQRATLDRQYGGLDAEYDKKLAQFNIDLGEYEEDLEDYNKDVAYWNKRGGAPEDEYEDLKDEQKKLDKTYEALKDREKELKSLASKINGIANKENSIINNYNSTITTYQNKYGAAQEFEKGVYDSAQGITIYQFRETADLRLTLAHELGHALGIGHTQDPQSLMYYLMGEQNLENPTPTAEDAAELKTVCELN
ncbi:MAG: matrixin family metalloprotease [Parcubacteria group bacterium]